MKWLKFTLKPEHVSDILAGIEERDKKLVFNFYLFFINLMEEKSLIICSK